MEFDLDGETSDSIHSEIYRARPDVMAVVHSHSPAVVPQYRRSASRAVVHMAGFLTRPTPVFEIRDILASETDLLIRDSNSAMRVASSVVVPGRRPWSIAALDPTAQRV